MGKYYFMEQLREMIDFLEVQTGYSFDFGRLAEVMSLSGEACRLWKEILDMAALSPAPYVNWGIPGHALYHINLWVQHFIRQHVAHGLIPPHFQKRPFLINISHGQVNFQPG
ncbi:MAG: 2-hydroxyacyl-CoA dehydratase family protein [Bacillota bacterium]